MPIDPVSGVLTQNGTSAEVQQAILKEHNYRRDLSESAGAHGRYGGSFVASGPDSSIIGMLWQIAGFSLFLGIAISLVRALYQNAGPHGPSLFRLFLCGFICILAVGLFIAFIRLLISFIRIHPVATVILFVGGIWLYRQLPPLPHIGRTGAAVSESKPQMQHKR